MPSTSTTFATRKRYLIRWVHEHGFQVVLLSGKNAHGLDNALEAKTEQLGR